MDIVAAIKRVSSSCKAVYVDGFAANGPLLNEHGITTPLRATNFVAQFLGETGGGTVIQESGNYRANRILEIFGAGHHSAAVTPAEARRLAGDGPALFERVYGLGNPRKAHELGNTQPGDGWKFRGIGVLQSTGRGAAKRWGDKCGADFTADVMLMVDPRYVLMPALFEWSAGNLNVKADHDDLRGIRRVINGGYNGLADVQAWHNKLWPILSANGGAVASWQIANPLNQTSDLQQKLNALGYTPALKVDGRYGPATDRAVRWFQRTAGVKVDGAAGPITLAALALRLDARHVTEPAVAA